MTQENLKFSLILPVYNVESYLEQCIASCESQDIPKEEYELIAINDGSTDASLHILSDLAAKHSNLKVISQSNVGLSGARNAGLQLARGEYIWFIDSDDVIKEDVLSDIYNKLKLNDLDAIHIGYQKICNSGEFNTFKPKLDGYKNVCSGIYFLNNILREEFYAWSFIFKKHFLLQNSFKYTLGITFEDIDSIPILLLKAKRIAAFNRIAYFYRQRSNSIIHSVNYKMIDDMYGVCLKYNNLLFNSNAPKIEQKIYKRLISSFLISYYIFLSKMNCATERNMRFKEAMNIFTKLFISQKNSIIKNCCVIIYNFSPYILFFLLKVKNYLKR